MQQLNANNSLCYFLSHSTHFFARVWREGLEQNGTSKSCHDTGQSGCTPNNTCQPQAASHSP